MLKTITYFYKEAPSEMYDSQYYSSQYFNVGLTLFQSWK